jgi:RsiW-degrading membrane proteinase PrsW (M82 family)
MNEQRSSGIGRIALKYGLLQGVLSFFIFLGTALTGSRQNWSAAAVTTALLVVLMVLAHREFKKTHDGMMSYPQGLGSGTLLSGWGALVKCVPVYIYVRYINTGYFAAAMRAQQAALERRGITGEQAQRALSITESMMTPVGTVVISLIAGVIVGFVVALIVSIFTHKGDGASYGSRPPG